MKKAHQTKVDKIYTKIQSLINDLDDFLPKITDIELEETLNGVLSCLAEAQSHIEDIVSQGGVTDEAKKVKTLVPRFIEQKEDPRWVKFEVINREYIPDPYEPDSVYKLTVVIRTSLLPDGEVCEFGWSHWNYETNKGEWRLMSKKPMPWLGKEIYGRVMGEQGEEMFLSLYNGAPEASFSYD